MSVLTAGTARNSWRTLENSFGFQRISNGPFQHHPRTPEETDRLICSLVREQPDICYIPFLRTEPGWIEQQYSSNKTVWVTGDSMSMVYEALTAGCRVGIIPVNWKKMDNKFLYSLNYLIDSNRIITLNQYLDGTSFYHEAGLLNESERCAKEILKRWWPENLR